MFNYLNEYFIIVTILPLILTSNYFKYFSKIIDTISYIVLFIYFFFFFFFFYLFLFPPKFSLFPVFVLIPMRMVIAETPTLLSSPSS